MEPVHGASLVGDQHAIAQGCVAREGRSGAGGSSNHYT